MVWNGSQGGRWEKGALGFTAILLGVVALLARDSSRSLEIVQHRGDVASRVVAAGYSAIFYLIKTAVPVDIIPCYPSPRFLSIGPTRSMRTPPGDARDIDSVLCVEETLPERACSVGCLPGHSSA